MNSKLSELVLLNGSGKQFYNLDFKGSVTGVFLDVFLIISEQVAEVYLEPSPTSTMEFFCENS